MLSYSYLLGDAGSAGGHYVELQEAKLLSLLRELLSRVEVDEAWYLKTNQDVADAVKSGAVASARMHYVTAGYFENRLPRPVKVDEAWYLAEYPDVANAIRVGTMPSAIAHFMGPGFLEGRLPHAGWSLLRDQNPTDAGRTRAAA